jgi:LPXTG-motif cell wall-anchored protein
MKRIVTAFAAMAALVLAGVAGLGGTHSAQATKWTIEGFATSAEEVPSPGNVQARAFVRFVFDDSNNTLTYAVTQSGFSEDLVTASHIHRGAKGVAGPVIYPLSLTGFTQVSGTLTLSAADVADLKAGNLYFNVHSKVNPAGYARMQLLLPAAALAPTPSGARPALTAPNTGDGGLLGTTGSTWLPVVGFAALLLSGGSVFALARRKS